MSKKIPVILCNMNILSGVTSWGVKLKRAFQNHDKYEILLLNLWCDPDDKFDFNAPGLEETYDIIDSLAPAIVVPNYIWHIPEGYSNKDIRFLGLCHSDSETEYYAPLSKHESLFSKFIAVSPVCADTLKARIPKRTNDIITLPYGISVPESLHKRYQVGPIRLVYGGRVVQLQKRVFDFIPLVKNLLEYQVDFVFDIVGDGDDHTALQEAMMNEVPTERVWFLGLQSPESMSGIWYDHDIFIQVSDFEGTSISMLEAMAQGTVPVVTAATSGVSSVITHAENGLIVPVGDMEAMARSIVDLVSKPDSLSAMGKAAHQNAKRYSIQAYVKEFSNVLDQIFDSSLQSKSYQHIPIPSDTLPVTNIRTDGPWQRLGLSREEVSSPLSMLTDEEVFYAYWLARDYYKGEGAIVDAGCLLGGSTVAFASGLAKNSNVANKQEIIHAYDLFRYEDYMSEIRPNAHIQVGDNLLPYFQKNIEAYRKYVRVYADDLLEQIWSGLPIEILFVDVAKTWALNNHVIREFYSSLIPGRSIVVHQDYFYFGCHWIHITMQFLSSYFEPMHATQYNCLAFRLTKKIPAELLNIDYSTYFSKEEALKLMDLAIAQQTGTHKSFVKTAKIGLLLELTEYEQAHRLIEEIRQSPNDAGISVAACIKIAEQRFPSNTNGNVSGIEETDSKSSSKMLKAPSSNGFSQESKPAVSTSPAFISNSQTLEPHKSYIICSTDHAGSNLLCELLAKSEVSGNPDEYFSGEHRSHWGERLETSTFPEYLQEIPRATSSSNGVFGVTFVGVKQFREFTSQIRRLPAFQGKNLSTAEMIAELFPNVQYIWLTRRDKIQQAVPYAKMIQSDQYLSTQSRASELTSDLETIQSSIQEISLAEAVWQAYFTEEDITPLSVIYEDLYQKPEEVIRLVLDYLGIPTLSDWGFDELMHKSIDDETSEYWAKQYYEHLLKHHPTLEDKSDSANHGTVINERNLERIHKKYKVPGSVALSDIRFIWSLIERERPTYFLEIGVASGLSTAFILEAMENISKNSTLISIDLWDKWYFDTQKDVGFLVEKIKGQVQCNFELRLEKWAADLEDILDRRHMDMAFIDANHGHPWATLDTILLLPFLKRGGSVIYHDIQLYRQQEWATEIGPHYVFTGINDEKLPISEEHDHNIGAIKFNGDYRQYEPDLLNILQKDWTLSEPIHSDFIERIKHVISRYYSPEFTARFAELVERKNQ